MLSLHKSLEFIEKYLEKNAPGIALEKGLSYEGIQKITEKLPFELPLEIYELYMWRNGGCLEIIPISYLSVEINCEVIQSFFPLNKSIQIAKEWNNGWFPLFDSDGVIFWIIGTQNKQKTTPIFCNDEFILPNEPCFQSLTEMMAKIVEGVKTIT